MQSLANIDISTAKSTASFRNMLYTVTETVDDTSRYLLSKLVVAPGRSGADATIDQLLHHGGLECIGVADASSQATLNDIAIAAAVEGGTPQATTERISTPVLRATLIQSYPWRPNDDWGVLSVPGS